MPRTIVELAIEFVRSHSFALSGSETLVAARSRQLATERYQGWAPSCKADISSSPRNQTASGLPRLQLLREVQGKFAWWQLHAHRTIVNRVERPETDHFKCGD